MQNFISQSLRMCLVEKSKPLPYQVFFLKFLKWHFNRGVISINQFLKSNKGAWNAQNVKTSGSEIFAVISAVLLKDGS